MLNLHTVAWVSLTLLISKTAGDFQFPEFNSSICTTNLLSEEKREEIASYQTVVDTILEITTKGSFRSSLFNDLAYFTDTYGPRASGSPALQEATEYLQAVMGDIGMSNVHGEKAMIPKWERGDEKAELLSPREKSLKIKGLGASVGTPPEGIVGEIIAISNFESLMKKSKQVKGKILLFNNNTVSTSALFQYIGSTLASRFGAVAALVRATTPFSLYTTTTGIQYYDERFPKIPTASIAPEDADILLRFYQRGELVVVNLTMNSTQSPDVEGWNVFGDYEGYGQSDEYVSLAGHIDSWDNGEGALDDGIGVILALNSVKVLNALGLRPRRTIRNMLFTAEEVGLIGSEQWAEKHRAEFPNVSAALEADYGCLAPMGLLLSGSPEAGCILSEIISLFKDVNVTSLRTVEFLMTDVYVMTKSGVPGIVLNGDDGKYFYYHHTEADGMTALRTENLDVCLGIWTATSYIIADLKDKLPR